MIYSSREKIQWLLNKNPELAYFEYGKYGIFLEDSVKVSNSMQIYNCNGLNENQAIKIIRQLRRPINTRISPANHFGDAGKWCYTRILDNVNNPFSSKPNKVDISGFNFALWICHIVDGKDNFYNGLSSNLAFYTFFLTTHRLNFNGLEKVLKFARDTEFYVTDNVNDLKYSYNDNDKSTKIPKFEIKKKTGMFAWFRR